MTRVCVYIKDENPPFLMLMEAYQLRKKEEGMTMIVQERVGLDWEEEFLRYENGDDAIRRRRD